MDPVMALRICGSTASRRWKISLRRAVRSFSTAAVDTHSPAAFPDAMPIKASPSPDLEIDIGGGQKLMRYPELDHIKTMKSSDLRRLCESAVATKNTTLELWIAIAQRALESADSLKVWDAIIVLESFAAVNMVDRTLFLALAEQFPKAALKMEPRLIISLFTVYEKAKLRPRLLYVELFHSLMKQTDRMYGHELADVLAMMARLKVGNPQVLRHMCRALVKYVHLLRFLHVCCVYGALRSLDVTNTTVYEVLEKRADMELQMLPVQELLDALQSVGSLEFSWHPFEKMLLNEYLKRTTKFEDGRDVDELADPFAAMDFMRAHGLLHKEFLTALCKWCVKATYRPAKRSWKRPMSHQLVQLHDICREWGLEENRDLQQAIRHFVSTKGGTDRYMMWRADIPKSTTYATRRPYFLRPDPLERYQAILASQPPTHADHDADEVAGEEDQQEEPSEIDAPVGESTREDGAVPQIGVRWSRPRRPKTVKGNPNHREYTLPGRKGFNVHTWKHPRPARPKNLKAVDV
ncbi:unnamed protein product [Vitrella brassicaformis CCMP3155]|uniref:RNA-editing substrate-binding complex 6 protein domain-containing protein n=2 Tax=Vitrella brassicaformis TaxID=1169539 RepID=A0A0G4EXW7_VITBC|nr:unnamed protein product [Vitrella brassicaformis CCMP3155]|eukprot:CEM03250.1 unnamed protein product [Vitrella brassicaformis CCMP3155]